MCVCMHVLSILLYFILFLNPSSRASFTYNNHSSSSSSIIIHNDDDDDDDDNNNVFYIFLDLAALYILIFSSSHVRSGMCVLML